MFVARDLGGVPGYGPYCTVASVYHLPAHWHKNSLQRQFFCLYIKGVALKIVSALGRRDFFQKHAWRGP